MSASTTAWEQSPKEFNTATLHHVGSKFSSNNAREGNHLWRVHLLGIAQPQPFPISPTYITRRAKFQQCTHLMEPYAKKFYLYASSIKNCTRLQSEASSSEVFHQDIQHELLCLCSALQEQPVGPISSRGQDSTLRICTETSDDISAETMEKGPVI